MIGDSIRKRPADGIYQPMIIYNLTIKNGFHKEALPYPMVSNDIFFSAQDAAQFLGIFIRQLINDKLLPEDVIKNGELDRNLVKTYIRTLHPSEVKYDERGNSGSADESAEAAGIAEETAEDKK